MNAEAMTELAPTIDVLLSIARTAATSSIEAAKADAATLLDHGHADAAAILAQARADGKAAAEHAASAAITVARRTGRERILSAHRRAYEALYDGICKELRHQASSSSGIALFAKLTALAHERLGPNAVVTQLEDGRIGVHATDGKLSLELSADRYVQREIATLGDRIEALWK